MIRVFSSILFLFFLSTAFSQLVDSTSFSTVKTAFALEKPSDENIWNKPIIGLRDGDTYFDINPWFELGLDRNGSENYIRNSRGFVISGKSGNFRFLSALQETQLDAKKYQEDQIQGGLALRGRNRFKFKNDIYDFADFMGGVHYSNSRFWASVASAPLKIGEGIRSVIIDNHNIGYAHVTGGVQFYNNKLELSYGLGTTYDSFRLKRQIGSESPIARRQVSWFLINYKISKNFELLLYSDSNTPLYAKNDSSEFVRASVDGTSLIPGTTFFKNNTQGRYFRGRAQLLWKYYFGATYASFGDNGYTIGSRVNKHFGKTRIDVEGQFISWEESRGQIGQFGQALNKPWLSSRKELLFSSQAKRNNLLLAINASYFEILDPLTTKSTTFVQSLVEVAYRVHPASNLYFGLFADYRNLEVGSEKYLGVKLYNRLGIKDRNY